MPLDSKKLPKIAMVQTKGGGFAAYIAPYTPDEGERVVRNVPVPLHTEDQLRAWKVLMALDELTPQSAIRQVIALAFTAGYEYGGGGR